MGAVATPPATSEAGRVASAARVGFGGLSDESLARMVAGGNRHAFTTVYERYRAPLSRYCRSILHHPDDAADAFQNAMLKALAGLEREAPAGPLRPWLYRIAHNESIDLIRRRQRSAEDLVADTPDVTDISASTEVADQLQALFTDLRELPERQRGALLMRELAGLEYEQIGRVFATSAVAARKLVYEARVSLRAQREGPSADCDHICRQLSDGDGRTARARAVRAHLASCEACAAFERSLRTRREQLALVPALPLLGGGAWLAATLGGGAGATKGAIAGGGAVAGGAMAGGTVLTAGAGAGLGAGASSAGVVSGLSSALALKCLTVCGALAVAGAGTAIATSAGHHVAPAAHRLALAGGASSATASVGDAHPAAAKRALAQAASALADQQVAGGSHASAAGSRGISAAASNNSGAGAQVTSLGVTSSGVTSSGVSRPVSAGTGSTSRAAGTGSPSGATGTAGTSSSAGAKPGSGRSSSSSTATGSSSTSTVATSSGSTSSSPSVTTPAAATAPTDSGTGSTGPSDSASASGGQSGPGLSGTGRGTPTANADGGTASTTGSAGLINGIISTSTAAATSSSTLAGGIEGLVSSILSGDTAATGPSGTSTSSDSAPTGGYGAW